MLQFILNNKLIKTDKSPSSILLDFIRYDQHLTGTKSGCREGDCGACSVLVGTLNNNSVHYESMTACLTPLANIHGKHVVTVEGINSDVLSPVQNALHVHSATQCGFCTPGFVVSLTGHVLSERENTFENAINSISGNICRCTGYKSIEKAVDDIVKDMKHSSGQLDLNSLIKQKYLPEYFKDIPYRLSKTEYNTLPLGEQIIGGGTDLYVQDPDKTSDSNASYYFTKTEYKGIIEREGSIFVGASVTANEMMYSEVFNNYFPKIKQWFKLISSEQIRNMATLAGNIVNASPIGDLTIFFLALNAELFIGDSNGNERKLPLKDFFRSYKILDLNNKEYIKHLRFFVPDINFKFNFEKVSKRTYLDIASVNTAISYTLANNIIKEIHISGGGLAPIPKYFSRTREFLKGKELNQKNIQDAVDILQSEVDPISDIRGSKEYKRLLLKQLFMLHFEE